MPSRRISNCPTGGSSKKLSVSRIHRSSCCVFRTATWSIDPRAARCRSEHQWGEDWGAYTVDETALRHGAGVREETSDRAKGVCRSSGELTPYQDGWLPG